MFSARILIALWVSLLASTCCACGQSPLSPAKESLGENKKPSSRLSSAEIVQRGVSAALSMHDEQARIVGLTRVAKVACDFDKSAAKSVFMDAQARLSVIEVDTGAKASDEAKVRATRLKSIRNELYSAAGACDAALGKRFVAADHHEDVAQPALSAASAQLSKGNTQGAADFLNSAEQAGLSGFRQFLDYVHMLQDLHKTQPQQADAMFMQALQDLDLRPFVDANEVMAAGNYVFAPGGTAASNGSRLALVSNVGTVTITGDRPDVPIPLVQAYLDIASDILSRPVEDPVQQQIYYVAAYQLMPKLQQYLPAKVSMLAVAMQVLTGNIPPALADPQAFSYVMGASPVPSVDEIEKNPDVNKRDALYLGAVNSLWQHDDFKRARTFADAVHDSSLKKRLAELIDFGEAAASLKKSDVDTTERFTRQMPSGLPRSLIQTGMAAVFIERHDLDRANDFVNHALRDLEACDDLQRPYAEIAVAGQIARFHPVWASGVLQMAFHSLNTLDHELDNNDRLDANERARLIEARKEGAFARVILEVLGTGPSSRSFQLRVTGVKAEAAAVLVGMRLDPDGSFDLLPVLQNEDRQLQLLPAILRQALTHNKLTRGRTGEAASVEAAPRPSDPALKRK
jgi:hypothetical protein